MTDTSNSWRRWIGREIACALAAAAAMILATLLDRWALVHLAHPFVGPGAEPDWARLLRLAGYLPTWIIVGVTLLLARPDDADRPVTGRGPAAWRGVSMIAAPLLAGVLAELVKLLVRRVRPEAADLAAGGPLYHFRAWAGGPLHHFWTWAGADHPWWHSSGLGLPSSHAAVAFAAATVLAVYWPRMWLAWFALAVGCAATRVMAQAHFLSDVTAGAILGIAVAWAWTRRGLTPP